MNRKLFILTGCLVWLGIVARAQAPVAQFTSNVTSGCGPLIVQFKDLSTNNPTSWEWDFGNGNTSSAQNPTETFYAGGPYTVTLIAKNASGAGATRQVGYITVIPSPNVSFGLNYNLACTPVDIQFLQYSQPGAGTIVSYAWAFGDGTTGSGPTPQHLYTQTGYYNVTLTVTNSGGCSNSVTYYRTLRVVPGIQPNFTWNETSACTAPFTLNFLNQTAGPGNLTYNWTLGAGATPATSTATNPTVTYPAAGSYPVNLTVQSNLGCSDTITQTVPVSSNIPVIHAPAAGCLNTPVTFANATTPAPLSSSWNFGDGGTSTQDSTTHTYTTPGTYPITLTNTYSNCSSTATATITIAASLTPSFTASPATGCQTPLSVQFTDQTSPAPTQWQWSFGDGGFSSQPNPQHTYTSTGFYTVALTATTAAGCSGTTTITKEISIATPKIYMTNASGCVGSPITPTYSVSTADAVTSYAWSAPNATPSTSTAQFPAFTYSSQGYYSITLTITTSGGCTTSQTFNNIVQVGTPSTPAFTFTPTTVCGNDSVTFTSTGLPADAWYWNFGDGTPADSGVTVRHAFQKLGMVPVILTIDNFGCKTSSPAQYVTVNPPIPKFNPIVNCTVSTYNVSVLDSSLTNGDPTVTYTWNFGDGSPAYTTSTGPNYAPPAHQYPTYGTYTITLIITDDACTDTLKKNITLYNFIPSFTVAPNPVCVNQPFTLNSTSQQNPPGSPTYGYIWTIGTDSIHQSHQFSTSLGAIGSFPVSLTITDGNGCTYTTAPGQTITVTGPTAKFTNPAGGCLNSPVTFTDQSTPYSPSAVITSWNWNFGDRKDTTFTAAPFTHSYADTGSYTVTLTITDASGCQASDTVTSAIQITSPFPNFGVPDSFYCPAAPLTFIDSSQGYGLTESWNFGDGSGNFTSPTHSFPAASGVTYPVTLTATDKNGCTADTTKKVLIESPIAAFSIADTTAICAPLQTQFTAAGQYYDSLYWEFGDGSTSTLPVTYHFYNSYVPIDTFTATLVVQGPGGCRDSASRRVLLLDPYTTSTFNFNPKTACDSVVATFNVIPPGYTSFYVAFGDGTADSTGNETLVHTYRNPNTFVPLLYLTDATGCIVTIADTALTVLGAVPFFTVNQSAFCDTATIVFTDYTITNNGVLSKTYNFGDGTVTNQPPPLTNPFDTTHYYNTPGNLLATLNVVTLANCTASFTDTIHVWQTPHPTIADTGNLCAGLIQFIGSLTIPEVDSVSWLWNFGNGQTANVQSPLVNTGAGTYNISLKASVPFGCSDTATATVTVNPLPTIKGPAQISTPVGVPVTIPFQYSNDIETWTWNPTIDLSCPDCANPTATLTFNQAYTVLVVDSNNCTDTASILIKTICNEGNYFLPNTFSPNGDGVNDWFYPRGTSLYNIQSMTVFNRWGQMVFQRKNFPANSETMGWDGTFNGQPASSDAYVYIVEVICNNGQVVALHGNVTLIR